MTAASGALPIPAPLVQAWAWLGSRAHHSDPLPSWVTLLIMCVTTAATAGKAWKVTQLPATLAHELGHAYVGNMLGRTITGIKLSPDTSGVTHSAGKPYGIAYTLTVLAGYFAPPLVGVACAWAALNGWAGLALCIMCALLALAVPFARNLLALLIMVGTMLPSWYALNTNHTPTVTAIVQGLGAYLGVAGLRATWSLFAAHRQGSGEGSDADQLRSLTLIPATIWIATFATVATLCLGAQLLLLLNPHVV